MTNIKKIKKFQKVVMNINSDIETGKLRPNQQLASENDLATLYGVSRITIRKALEVLVQTNQISKFQGRCTIINNQIVDKKLNEIVSFTKSSLLRNEIPSTRVIFLKLTDPNPFVANMLGINVQDKVWHIKRVRYTNGFPLIFEESFWVENIVGPISEEIVTSSMFSHIKSIGIFPKTAKQDLDAIIADEDLSRELDVRVGYPLLRSTMVVFDSKNIPFEMSLNYHRTDRVKLSLIRNLNE